CLFFFSSRRRHTRFSRDWSSDVCSSDLVASVFGRQLPNTDATHPEITQIGARPAAPPAAVVGPNLELRLAVRLCNHRFLGHESSSDLSRDLAEREPERLE